MHLGHGGIDWISSSDLLVWNRLVLTDALMSHTTASKARRTRVTFRRSFSSEKEPEPEPPGHLKDLALHATSCYAYDEESRTASDRAEERSYMSCPDIAQCFNTETKKMVDYAWRPVTDGKLLGFSGSVACKKRGWFPYENGHALVSHRAKALRGPDPTYNYKVKD